MSDERAMAKKLGIVVSARSRIIRRTIEPDDDRELQSGHVGPGEEMVIVDKAGLVDGDHKINLVRCALIIEQVTGDKPPSSSRCVAVRESTGTVVAVLSADPEIDAFLDHKLILHDEAHVGWKWSAHGGFRKPL